MFDKLGTLQPRKLVDVLVVEGIPDRSIDDLENVVQVVRVGETIVNGWQEMLPRHVPVPKPRAQR